MASNAFKHRELPASIVSALLGKTPCVTFVTLAELTKWAVVRDWGPTYKQRLEAWLNNVLVLPYGEDLEEVARTWGTIAGYAP